MSRSIRSSPDCAASSQRVPGAQLYLQASQDIRVGGRQSNAQFEFTLEGDSTAELYAFAPRLVAALQHDPNLADVNSDQQQKGLGDRPGDRPRHCGAARHHASADRQYALRRLRPAPGVHDLQGAEPVPRRHGGGAALLAEPGDAEADLRQHLWRQRQRHPDQQRAHRHRRRERQHGCHGQRDGDRLLGPGGQHASATVGGLATSGSAGSGTGGSTAAASSARNAGAERDRPTLARGARPRAPRSAPTWRRWCRSRP